MGKSVFEKLSHRGNIFSFQSFLKPIVSKAKIESYQLVLPEILLN